MVKEKEDFKFVESEYDPDASQKTWDECYKKIYKTDNWDFWFMFDFENLKKTYNKVRRFYAPIIINEKYWQFNQYPYFKMSGDTDFNFGKNKVKNQKYEKFEALLQRDYQGNKLNDYLDKLSKCHGRYHKMENFTLMPITGGLQLIKQNCANDRMDVFVYTLSKYYKTGILDHARNRNRKALETYLMLFAGIYDYCSKIYMIESKQFVKKIISQGMEQIDCGERVVKYMNLAEEFWENKISALEKSSVIIK